MFLLVEILWLFNILCNRWVALLSWFVRILYYINDVIYYMLSLIFVVYAFRIQYLLILQSSLQFEWPSFSNLLTIIMLYISVDKLNEEVFSRHSIRLNMIVYAQNFFCLTLLSQCKRISISIFSQYRSSSRPKLGHSLFLLYINDLPVCFADLWYMQMTPNFQTSLNDQSEHSRPVSYNNDLQAISERGSHGSSPSVRSRQCASFHTQKEKTCLLKSLQM